MDLTLSRFVAALRNAEVRVSPAETLDGLDVLRKIGVHDPQLLRSALSLTLAKSREEKRHFEECFERFFVELAFRSPVKRSFFKSLDRDRALADLAEQLSHDTHAAVAEVFHNDRAGLAVRVEAAAQLGGIEGMHSLRDKPHYAALILKDLGAPEIDTLLADEHAPLDRDTVHALRYVRHYLQQEIHEFVDARYRLTVDASGKKAILDAALTGNLTHIPTEYYADVQRVVEKLAHQLAKEHKRRRRRARRGVLDIKRTLRGNMGYDEALFKLEWRRRKVEKASVFAICDVSGSVSRVARFLLLLLYNLTDVLPQVRSFAFSNRLGEVTDVFRNNPVEVAIEEVLFEWGKGNTDYGHAFLDLRKLCLNDIDHRSTVIILGDARNNYYDPHPERLKDIALRAKQVLWLNPEMRDDWGEGDSEMPRYAPHCFKVSRCNSLSDLERFADSLIMTQR
jgi:uncharacterized protein with von Willebrand factor type A (vWA) domain